MNEKRRKLRRSFRRYEEYEVCSDAVDDTRLELVNAAAGRQHSQHIRLSRAQAQKGHKFESVFLGDKKLRSPKLRSYMVDDTRLELVTSRTSSGCATSCANRPALYQHVVFYNMSLQMSSFF